ncbi:hypothetical protein BUALT_Bualt06G0119900 [Buddleja alternifolia]|uniref:Alpha/beta hydrolase fold-3 domain-containing protein n=1 Tax=Buddleja alternifolia TaxID=168488 RepID=A0AAV6XLA7_9LAMI|nr:hypothetical protein BUALT_Bualt06G0119900 [Buddleja alternifolia]
MSSNETKPIDPYTDPYGFLGIIKNSDGSITRKQKLVPANSDLDRRNNPNPVLSKDIPINQANNTWARIYLRRPESDATPTTKQPLIIYFHGGGFVLGSASTPIYHKFCCDLANEIPAVIVSVEYRLGPEHRLPAAYDDSMEALRWVSAAADEWLTKYADFSKCFLMGMSAGGNIAYRVGLRMVTCGEDLMPLKIQGLILHHPFFGGVQRTSSEIRMDVEKVCPLSLTDIMWELGLPVSADRDHEYCNPMIGIRPDLLQKMKGQRWKVMVIGGDKDPLLDREIEFMKMLKEQGVDVVGHFSEGGTHGFEFFDVSKAKILYGLVKNFILSKLFDFPLMNKL